MTAPTKCAWPAILVVPHARVRAPQLALPAWAIELCRAVRVSALRRENTTTERPLTAQAAAKHAPRARDQRQTVWLVLHQTTERSQEAPVPATRDTSITVLRPARVSIIINKSSSTSSLFVYLCDLLGGIDLLLFDLFIFELQNAFGEHLSL